MAGYTDSAFRRLCMENGAAYCVTEMVSAKGLVQGNRTAQSLTNITENELPCAVQLFSDEPSSMARAVQIVKESYADSRLSPFMFDINCGCPARKIAGHGGGAALMREPQRAAEICAAAVKAAGDTPVSVKLRLGWDDDSRNAVEFAGRMEDAGAALLTVHGRTRAQMYAPPVDAEGIAQVKAAVHLPVIANGDVTGGESAARLLAESGCDGVAVGRGALGRPWVFAQIRDYLTQGLITPEPDAPERLSVMLRHVKMLCATSPDGIRQARKVAAHYLKGLVGAAGFRARIVRISSLAELEALYEEILTQIARI
jgi:nifR3 family TIM-barrel protein